MDSRSPRIVFFGTPDFAVASLDSLVSSGYNVVGVVTAVDKPAGRGKKLSESAVKKYAGQAGIPVLQPEKLKDPVFLERYRALDPDLGIVIAFRMLPKEVWSQPRLGTFNLHASLLPQYRGAAPINRAIMNGEKVTGITTFLLDENIDTGGILLNKEIPIHDEDDAGTLHDRMMVMGGELVRRTVDGLVSGKLKPVPQPSSEGELKPAPKIFREDCRIDWTASAEDIRNHIRGLSPYPGAWTFLIDRNGEGKVLKIYRAAARDEKPAESPGSLIIDPGKSIGVACRGGVLMIEELQPEGKKKMSSKEFLNGNKDLSGYRVG